ncbi:hypothetical protein Syun_021149 [Stephania yunnanensis]|uniref:Uncharacterized protein n=1 Tax=Stephania yunnanensis TaxID=152371 RepID=A0AAP0NNW2_9MAGN
MIEGSMWFGSRSGTSRACRASRLGGGRGGVIGRGGIIGRGSTQSRLESYVYSEIDTSRLNYKGNIPCLMFNQKISRDKGMRFPNYAEFCLSISCATNDVEIEQNFLDHIFLLSQLYPQSSKAIVSGSVLKESINTKQGRHGVILAKDSRFSYISSVTRNCLLRITQSRGFTHRILHEIDEARIKMGLSKLTSVNHERLNKILLLRLGEQQCRLKFNKAMTPFVLSQFGLRPMSVRPCPDLNSTTMMNQTIGLLIMFKCASSIRNSHTNSDHNLEC